jgi:universal stress protein E
MEMTMHTYTNLLVGIDVDAHGQLASGSEPAITEALRLARRQGARLAYMHAINLPEAQSEILGMQPQSAAARRQRQVQDVLDRLVQEARDAGVQATARLAFGPDWRELILAVQQEGHDLVIVGTRGRSIVGRTLLGSTGNRLLRYCPCPVWCVKHEAAAPLRAVLVADDLSDTGQSALALGALIAAQQHADLHVLHVLELPEERRFLGSLPAGELEQHQRAAVESLQDRIAALGELELGTVHISIGGGSAYAAILDYLRAHPIDLLCMGTVARSGLQGLLTGNTAENVLPWIDCSLVAVKPQGFVSPVLGNEHDFNNSKAQVR